jgi:hypothetical protein
MGKLFHTDYRADLRVVTREGDPPPARVLAMALKALLRNYGIQCRDIAEVTANPAAGAASDGAGGPGGK